ncbi:MAG: DMT family transporter [Prevotellaceae bacterium]|nr:DMT family transporter [Prevotellaceae bacterium]
MEKLNLKGHAAMLTANASWGLMSPVAKIVMAGGIVSPLILTDLRFLGAMILFWIVSFFQKPEHVNHRDMAKLFGASLIAIVFNQGCFIFGVGLSSPADASIITTSMPLWAMVLAAIILKEPITGKKVLGIALGAGGALLLIIGSLQAQTTVKAGSHPIIGDLLVLLAQFNYALYIVLFKNFVNKYSLITIMKWMFTYSFICTLPFSYHGLMTTDWARLGSEAIEAIIFIVVFCTFISYMLIVIGQKNLRPTVAGMYNYIQPLVACIVSICLGMDSFNITKGIAVVLIFGGVYLVTVSKSKAEMEAAGKEV